MRGATKIPTLAEFIKSARVATGGDTLSRKRMLEVVEYRDRGRRIAVALADLSAGHDFMDDKAKAKWKTAAGAVVFGLLCELVLGVFTGVGFDVRQVGYRIGDSLKPSAKVGPPKKGGIETGSIAVQAASSGPNVGTRGRRR